MKYRILVPLDGSSRSEGVFPLLRLLAAKAEVELELLRCYEPPTTIYGLAGLDDLFSDVLDNQKLEAMVKDYLAQQPAKMPGVLCRTHVEQGYPSTCITARAQDNDFVVMSSLGLSGLEGWFLGSVTTRVVRSSPKPVLVVGGREISELALFLVALDGSETAERALDWALELAGLFGAKIVLYRFTGRSSAPLDAMAERQAAEDYLAKFAAAHGDRIHSTLVRQTDGPGYIAELATELGADVVFLGSRGRRSASTRWLLGSVAEDLVHHASCPVMVVP